MFNRYARISIRPFKDSYEVIIYRAFSKTHVYRNTTSSTKVRLLLLSENMKHRSSNEFDVYESNGNEYLLVKIKLLEDAVENLQHALYS